ncbi:MULTISPECIES: GerAB/ArcD/ProY family transporter [Paenibacillus]|uniref:GerAB/ArcD/ProY family transporter n=1 Tax=Paenibacillus TaxID=44249 RepID=UPI001915CF32|nr:GerAB/ArcD/ProY family transporter [Paenibacillus sp. EPM92]
MTSSSLFNKTSPYGGVYAMFLVNRLQMLYFVLVMPAFLVHPYMIWAIIAMGLLSQVNLIMLSRWFASDLSEQGYEGFVLLFGERTVRLLAMAGLLFILIKITVVTQGYTDIIHQYIFPSMNRNWLILFPILMSFYLAAQGMENMIRFIMIAYLSTCWMVIVFVPFYFSPTASLTDLYPLIPASGSAFTWKSLLFILSALSGPEYLILLTPWLNPRQKTLKYFTAANAYTIWEYLFLFIGALLFYGSHYLNTIKFPIVSMVRYLQSPVFERVDIFLVSVHMIYFMYAMALFLLLCYGAVRIIAGRVHAKTSQIGLLLSGTAVLLCMLAVSNWFWDAGTDQNMWLSLQSWSGACTYVLAPAVLLITLKRKRRV